MKIAIIGCTGLVGKNILKVLKEKQIHFSELLLAASKASINKEIEFDGRIYNLMDIDEIVNKRPDIAIFSAEKSVSLEYAPKFAAKGTYVIDNSPAWRMDKNVKLIVPEVNANILTAEDKIIANPNCSTIQLVVVLAPLHEKYKLKRVVISTYQSVTGSGYKGINQLMSERDNTTITNPAYPHSIDLNCIPHGGEFQENGYTDEETKIIYETRKILDIPKLAVTATAVRVPVVGGHSESVNIEFEKDIDSIEEIRNLLEKSQGIIVYDNPKENKYPMPILSKDKNETFVGRIRKDYSIDNAINLWITADNLRKGAATNAVQIAEYISKNYINGKA